MYSAADSNADFIASSDWLDREPMWRNCNGFHSITIPASAVLKTHVWQQPIITPTPPIRFRVKKEREATAFRLWCHSSNCILLFKERSHVLYTQQTPRGGTAGRFLSCEVKFPVPFLRQSATSGLTSISSLAILQSRYTSITETPHSWKPHATVWIFNDAVATTVDIRTARIVTEDIHLVTGFTHTQTLSADLPANKLLNNYTIVWMHVQSFTRQFPTSGFKVLGRDFGRPYLAVVLGSVSKLKPRLCEQKRGMLINNNRSCNYWNGMMKHVSATTWLLALTAEETHQPPTAKI